jgi:transposase
MITRKGEPSGSPCFWLCERFGRKNTSQVAFRCESAHDSSWLVGYSEVIPARPTGPAVAPECPHGINIGMRCTRDLTDEQWKTLDPLIPKPGRRPDGRGRPWKSRRSVLNGVLWVLRTGAPWADLPDRYPSFQTCHRRFQQWVRSGVMTRIMTALAHELSVRGAIDVREAFIDASFAPAKKGAAKSEKRNVARERRSWRWQTVMGCQFLFARRVPLLTR